MTNLLRGRGKCEQSTLSGACHATQFEFLAAFMRLIIQKLLALNHDTRNSYLIKFEIFIELRNCIYCKMIEYLMSRVSEHFWKFEVIFSKKSN